MRSGLTAAAVAALVTSVASQASSTVSQSMPPTATAGFNVAPIPEMRRFQWCLAQRNACPQICGGTTLTNDCTESDLTYSCVCSNGTAPDVSAYTETLPFYICEATYEQCIAANPNDAQGQDTCRKNQQCGTLNATAVEGSSGDSSASSSTSATAMATGSATAGSSASGSTGATPSNAAVAISHQLATTTFAAVFLAAFKLFL